MYGATPYAALPFAGLTGAGAGTILGFGGLQVAYEDVGILSASTLLFNRVEGTASGGVKQVADDLISQAAYGIRTLTLPPTENARDLDVLALCQLFLNAYSQPEVRFDQIGVELLPLQAWQQAQIAALDIGSVVVAERTPPGGGTRITQLSMIEHVSWSLDSTQGTAKLTVGLQNIKAVDYFLVYAPTVGSGLLDTDTLFF